MKPSNQLICALLLAAVAGCGSSHSSDSAARVNGHQISKRAYRAQIQYRRIGAEAAIGVDVCTGKGTAGLCTKLKQTALNDLIAGELVREYAAKHRLLVSNADVERQWALVFRSKFNSNSGVLGIYLRQNKLTLADLKYEIRLDLEQRAVLAHVTRAIPYSPAVLLGRIAMATPKELHKVQADLKAGRHFYQLVKEQLALKKSACAREGCGELGPLPYPLVPPGEKRVISAPAGSIVGPIVSQGGYVLLHVDAHTPRYRLTSAQQLTLRQRHFAAWLGQQETKAKIQRFV